MITRTPWRHSLFVRLFAAGALIAAVAVVAATWATVRSTTVAVKQQHQQTLHDEAVAYDALVSFAATHTSWFGARTLVARLARRTGQRVSVTDGSGNVLVSSQEGKRRAARLPPSAASATLNPLDVDTTLLAAPRAHGGQVALAPAVCGSRGCGRLVAPVTTIDAHVRGPFVGRARSAYGRLLVLTNRCVVRAGLPPALAIEPNFAATVTYRGHDAQVASCVESARQTMLAAFVAPPALLFVGRPGPAAQVLWTLSGHNELRIVLVAAAVLAVTFCLCALLAVHVVRPLRAMALAAGRAGEGDLGARVPVRRRDELGEVARAFNRMADRRQQLEEARRRMVTDVSHELRTPLANIGGWIEAAQDGLASPDQELLGTLHDETMTLQHLVDDLHQLSLGDAGELRIEPARIDTGVFAEQLVAAMSAGAEAAGVTLSSVAPEGLALDADPFRLRQAVANLVANAIRHTPPGGRVTIDATATTITVSDTGEGIAADELPHIMDRFRRADVSRSRATGGSGLGLAIMRQIVEAHGGTVEIHSALGAGTTVTLRFPGTSAA